MTDSEAVQMLDEASVAALGRVQVEHWTAQYDLKTDQFVLTVYWQGYGYGQYIPAASFSAIVMMFEAASRARTEVYYDGQQGNLIWSTGPIPV